jgi:hypothetical protein
LLGIVFFKPKGQKPAPFKVIIKKIITGLIDQTHTKIVEKQKKSALKFLAV